MKEEDDMVRFALMYVRGFIRKNDGQDLLEYSLLVALIAIGAIASVGFAGDKVVEVFDAITDAIVVPGA
jgi:Flp pilus assembly pilin Flp